ncbi:MAG: sarcosine oxidase subunit gamma [Pseudorhodobacter sp.]|nr:sarcosine oxidase subunit gamma [Pseudorhodobacter sp.]
MPELIAKSALSGQGSAVHGATTLAEVTLGPITSIAVFPGQTAAVTAALGHFPAPNTHADGLCWTGPDQAFLLGRAAPDLTGLAAVTDQSGGWAALRLSGPLAADTLLRHVPLNLHAMQPGQAARAPLGHMQMVLMAEPGGFLLLVFRSMARTAWHEIETSMKHLAARKVL